MSQLDVFRDLVALQTADFTLQQARRMNVQVLHLTIVISTCCTISMLADSIVYDCPTRIHFRGTGKHQQLLDFIVRLLTRNPQNETPQLLAFDSNGLPRPTFPSKGELEGHPNFREPAIST